MANKNGRNQRGLDSTLRTDLYYKYALVKEIFSLANVFFFLIVDSDLIIFAASAGFEQEIHYQGQCWENDERNVS